MFKIPFVTSRLFSELMSYDPEAHRARIVAAKQKSLEDYDKAIMTLSASALGVSLSFIKDIAPKPFLLDWALLAAWILWFLSLSLTVASFYIAKVACDVALDQLDRVEPNEALRTHEELGKGWNTATKNINVLSGTSFLVGVIFIVIFVYTNLQSNHERAKTDPKSQSQSSSPISHPQPSNSP